MFSANYGSNKTAPENNLETQVWVGLPYFVSAIMDSLATFHSPAAESSAFPFLLVSRLSRILKSLHGRRDTRTTTRTNRA
jgi:hypothetical protein